MAVRKTTQERNKRVLAVFHKLLRSGKDYTTQYMYEEAGAPCFLTAKAAGNIVRRHYNDSITDDMRAFVESIKSGKHDSKVRALAEEFNLCIRESRLIIRYID